MLNKSKHPGTKSHWVMMERFWMETRTIKQYLHNVNYILCLFKSTCFLDLSHFIKMFLVLLKMCFPNLPSLNVQNKWHSPWTQMQQLLQKTGCFIISQFTSTMYTTTDNAAMHFIICSFQNLLLTCCYRLITVLRRKRRPQNRCACPKLYLALGVTWERSDVFMLAREILE